MAEKIIAFLKKEANKEIIRKAKAKEQDVIGYICDSYYKGLKKRRKYMGGNYFEPYYT